MGAWSKCSTCGWKPDVPQETGVSEELLCGNYPPTYVASQQFVQYCPNYLAFNVDICGHPNHLFFCKVFNAVVAV